MKQPTKKNSAERDANIDLVITQRTGSVFAQLKRPDADDLLRKARVLNVINDVIEERKLDQAAAAESMGINQADVSRLTHGKLSRFSLERLMTLVYRLGVDIELRQSRDPNGHLVINVQQLTHA